MLIARFIRTKVTLSAKSWKNDIRKKLSIIARLNSLRGVIEEIFTDLILSVIRVKIPKKLCWWPLFLRHVTLWRDNYVFGPKFQENRLFNRLSIFSQAWNVFNKILRAVLHLLMVKVRSGLCWLKSNGHFTIFQ